MPLPLHPHLHARWAAAVIIVVTPDLYHDDPAVKQFADELMRRANVDPNDTFEIHVSEGSVEFHRYRMPLQVVDGEVESYVTVHPSA